VNPVKIEMIYDFWSFKFKALGFPTETARVFAYSVEYKSEQLTRYAPDKLPQYLQSQSEKRPDNFVAVPFLEYSGRKPKDEG
jgi:hypothetical protein